MPGVRLNALLASTAVALLLSAGGGHAQSVPPSGGDSSVTAPDSAKTAPVVDAPAAATDSENAESDNAEKPSSPPARSSPPKPAASSAPAAAPKSESPPAAAAVSPPAPATRSAVPAAPSNANPGVDHAETPAPSSAPAAPGAADMAPGASSPTALPASSEAPTNAQLSPGANHPETGAPAAPAATADTATQSQRPAPAAAAPPAANPSATEDGGGQKPNPPDVSAGPGISSPPGPANAPASAAAPPASAPANAQTTKDGGHPETEAPAGTAPAATATTPSQAPVPAAPGTPNATGNANAGAAAPSTPAATPQNPAATNVIAPASTLPPPDQQVADQLHQLSSGKFDRVLGGKTERAAIDAFYSGRSYAPIWITDGHANARAKAAMNYLAHVAADGLDPADYAVPNFGSLTDPQQLAEAELKFSTTVVTYARHASIGRVAWSRVNANIEYDTKAPELASVLTKLADAKDVAAALDAYEPHAPGYLALKAKLAEIRAGQAEGLKPDIARGRVPKVGEQDSRVAQLRERLGLGDEESNIYDKTLAEAVKKFQKEHGLKPTGALTGATVDALNGPRPTHVVDTILANMERWRWMPHDLGKDYVMINLPDFTASVFRDGKRIWKTKIVIGKPDMPTPIISAMMKYITVNPTWHVPPSIINREYLPAMAEDPTVMQRMGLVVERAPSGRVIGIYQPPGDRNAEGRLRFNFPNKFLVYQHDTPDKYMFGYAKRAFSHGCMRTQDPAKYAEVLLSLVRPNEGYTKERIERMYGPREINIDFPTPLPVHVTYQTAFVGDSGKLEFRDDIYGRDRQLLAILHNPAELRVADIPVERHVAAAHREILQAADNLPSFGRYDGQVGPGGFFARLFGGGFAPPPQPPARVLRRRRMSGAYRNWTTYDR